jgi:xanthine dehydrogenase YagR molybdenum-binding subunit
MPDAPAATGTNPQNAAPDYHWPPMDQRRVIGKRYTRLDGLDKSTGSAKYNSDVKPQGMLFAMLLTSPHAHAKITAVDTSAAEKAPGVTAVTVISKPGTEIMYEGWEIAAVAANTEEAARDGARAVKVEYEMLPHLVQEADVSKAGANAKPSGEQVTGDPDNAFKEADVVSEGHYGIPVITHCCLEPHGSTIAWGAGDHIEYWPTTQSVSETGGDLANAIKVKPENVHLHMDYIGGGFGSKFSAE